MPAPMAKQGREREPAEVMGHGSSETPAGVLVCVVDVTDCGRAAARVAARLGRELGLRIVVVHVTEVPV
jgi:hypothetical protein